MNILLTEDDQDIANNLIELLQNDYNIYHTNNINNTLKLLEKNNYHLIILDISLPDGNGLDLYKDYIKERNIPTIFLTAHDDEKLIVESLESGGEDYITKPFKKGELLTRIKRTINRYQSNSIIKVKDITFDLDKLSVSKNNEEINLTTLELRLLYLLFTNLNKIVTRDTIIEKIWEWTGNDVNDNTVTVYLKRIREKLNTDIIKTIKGIGYRIDSYE